MCGASVSALTVMLVAQDCACATPSDASTLKECTPGKKVTELNVTSVLFAGVARVCVSSVVVPSFKLIVRSWSLSESVTRTWSCKDEPADGWQSSVAAAGHVTCGVEFGGI